MHPSHQLFQDLPPLSPMELAEFDEVEIAFYPGVRTRHKADKVMAKVQEAVGKTLTIESVAPHESSKPMFRVNTRVSLHGKGAYPMLCQILEFLRPISAHWFVSLPQPEWITQRYWLLWGKVSATDIVGLDSVYFGAHERGFFERFPGGLVPIAEDIDEDGVETTPEES